MKTSQQGLTLLVERESAKTHAYQDSVGVWTIGVGHTGPEVHAGLVWTADQVERTFREDIARFEAAVNDGVKVDLAQHQFDALVSFAFNVGTSAFSKSTLLKKINDKDFVDAADEFDRWNIPSEIISRRNGEREQFKGTSFQARIRRTSVPGPVLRKGDRGAEVQVLQRALGINPDGDFGPKTDEAVRLFQTHHGLVSDGIVGPKTWAALKGD